MNRNWSVSDERRIFELHDAGLTWAEVASQMGRTERSVVWKAKSLRAAGLAETKPWRSARPVGFARVHAVRNEEQAVIPEHVLAAREARYRALERQDDISAFLGEPPPGYSALDRRFSD